MDIDNDTLAIVASVVGTGIALWRINKAEMNRLHADIGEVRNDISGLRERMARLEGAVDLLSKFLIDRERRKDP